VEVDRPWPAPAACVVVRRKWKYAPPPWVLYEAVVDGLDRWLFPSAGEPQPQVVASRRPDAVLLRPWLDPLVTAVELMIEQDGYGSAITVLAYGDIPQLSGDARGLVRHRLGTIFGSALRRWVDQPHN
jgi:hypothetical protein